MKANVPFAKFEKAVKLQITDTSTGFSEKRMAFASILSPIEVIIIGIESGLC